MINATYIPGFSSEQGIRHLVSPPTVTIRRLRSEHLHLVAFNWSTRSILVISVGLRCSSSYHSLTIHFYFIIWTVSILNWYSVWTSAYLYYYGTVSVLVLVRERVWIWNFLFPCLWLSLWYPALFLPVQSSTFLYLGKPRNYTCFLSNRNGLVFGSLASKLYQHLHPQFLSTFSGENSFLLQWFYWTYY